MRNLAIPLLATAVLLSLPSASHAGANANAKIQVHLGPAIVNNQCAAGQVACQEIVTSGGLYPPNLYYAYVLVTDGDPTAGVFGMQFGIDYGSGPADGTGFDIFSWILCASLEFQSPAPVWPSSGGGNLITWGGNCQTTEPGGAGTGVVAVAGYFYCGAYSPACLEITPRPIDNLGKVADCSTAEDVVFAGPPSHFGSACFGSAGAGYNPCGLVTPVEKTTWSAIKNTYRD